MMRKYHECALIRNGFSQGTLAFESGRMVYNWYNNDDVQIIPPQNGSAKFRYCEAIPGMDSNDIYAAAKRCRVTWCKLKKELKLKVI